MSQILSKVSFLLLFYSILNQVKSSPVTGSVGTMQNFCFIVSSFQSDICYSLAGSKSFVKLLLKKKSCDQLQKREETAFLGGEEHLFRERE